MAVALYLEFRLNILCLEIFTHSTNWEIIKFYN